MNFTLSLNLFQTSLPEIYVGLRGSKGDGPPPPPRLRKFQFLQFQRENYRKYASFPLTLPGKLEYPLDLIFFKAANSAKSNKIVEGGTFVEQGSVWKSIGGFQACQDY